MARVFVFSTYHNWNLPSLEEFVQTLPPDTKVIAYNHNWNQVIPYFMVAFNKPDENYLKWCDDKDKDIPIVLQVKGQWEMRS